jgi:hypothetical protein
MGSRAGQNENDGELFRVKNPDMPKTKNRGRHFFCRSFSHSDQRFPCVSLSFLTDLFALSAPTPSQSLLDISSRYEQKCYR